MTSPPLARYFSDVENQGRGYIDPRDPNGRRYPGVTSITGLVAKDLAQWGADQSVRWLANNWWQWNPSQRSEQSAFNAARYKHKEYRDERAEVGTGVHDYIDAWAKGEWRPVEFLGVEQQQMIHQFEECVWMTGLKPEASELTMFGGDWAGTLDLRVTAYSEKLGRPATGIVDIKTSKSIYPEVFMQIAALKSAKTQFRQVDPSTPGAIHLPDKKRGDSWWLIEDAPEMETAWILQIRGDFMDGEQFIPAKWELIELSEEELHLKRFEAYKAVWYAQKALKDAGVDLKKRMDSK